jgi:hypothetical protein
LVDFCCCAKELTAAAWRIVDIQTHHVDRLDRSVVTAIWDAIRRVTVASIYPVDEAFPGFPTL